MAAGPHFDPSALPSGFGPYQMRREIAVGGMGVVYEAYDPRLGRVIAVKLMRSLLLATADEKARFRTEAGAAAQLDHPNIVPVHEVGEQDGQPYFTMKLIEDGSLAERLKRGPLPFREAAVLMAKVARAVQHAHERGVLHRDLKPGNILLDGAGEPWLTDFGLAKVMAAGSDLTRTQSFLGTPEYMSPEQATGHAREIGPASDVWALGVILFQIVSGRLPFAAESQGEIFRKISGEEPATWGGKGRKGQDSAVLSVPPDLETLCFRCLEKDPARRPESAGFLADELSRWLAGEPLKLRPISKTQRAARWVRRRPWQVLAGFAMLAAVVALWFALSPRPPVIVPPMPDPKPLANPRLVTGNARPARVASLMHAGGGWIYGTCRDGGIHRKGTLFRFHYTTPGQVEVLAQFSGENGRDGGVPGAGCDNRPLLVGSDTIYGTTQNGGAEDAGVMYQADLAGGVEVIYEFGKNSAVRRPRALHEGEGGWLWGSAIAGCAHGRGGVFRFHPVTKVCEVIFSLGDAVCPPGTGHDVLDLVSVRPGVWMAIGGGSEGVAAIYVLGEERGPRVLHVFKSSNAEFADWPTGLCQGRDGAVYFANTGGGRHRLGSIERIADEFSAPVTVYHFSGKDGAHPRFTPITLPGEDLAGTTTHGGDTGQGVVYRFTPAGNAGGTLKVLGNMPPPGGDEPILCHGPQDFLYGANTDARDTVLFRIAPGPTGLLKELNFLPRHSWPAVPGPPQEPGRLLALPDGTFYGTCTNGGSSGFGTLFRWRDGGTPETLLEFSGPDGAAPGEHPLGQLALGADGALYGTTDFGGEDARSTLFRYHPEKKEFTTLLATHGIREQSGMIPGKDGALYGTTVRGGGNGNGSVFRIHPAGADRAASYEFMVDFTGIAGAMPGWEPGPLVDGGDGALYGATLRGGPLDHGTVFRVTADGVQTIAFLPMQNDWPAHHSLLASSADGWLYGMPLNAQEYSLWRVNLQTRAIETVKNAAGRGHRLWGWSGIVPGDGNGFLYLSRNAGETGDGGIYRIGTDGSDKFIGGFTGKNGALPGHGPTLEILSTPHGFYGTCPQGGVNNRGVIFRYRDGEAKTVWVF